MHKYLANKNIYVIIFFLYYVIIFLLKEIIKYYKYFKY